MRLKDRMRFPKTAPWHILATDGACLLALIEEPLVASLFLVAMPGAPSSVLVPA